jgi:hypothetical protein
VEAAGGEEYDEFLTLTLGRAAQSCFQMTTEIQVYFRFDGADINNRIQQMWDALMDFLEAKELYQERYRALMQERGILPKEMQNP